MADVNEFTNPILFLNGGNIDKLRGPYPTREAACLAIPNLVDENGKNFREGKFCEIGTDGNYVTHWWTRGYDDENLVEQIRSFILESYYPTNNLSIQDSKSGISLEAIKRIYSVANGTSGVNSTYLKSSFDNIASILNDAILTGIRTFRLEYQFTTLTLPFYHQLNIVSNLRNTNIDIPASLVGDKKITYELVFNEGEILTKLSLLSRFTVNPATQDLKVYVNYIALYHLDNSRINQQLREQFLFEKTKAYPFEAYYPTNNLSILNPKDGISLDTVNRVYSVATGTTSVSGSYLRSAFENVIPYINKAIEAGIYSFMLEYEFSSTISLSHQLNLSSNLRNTNLTLSSTVTGNKIAYTVVFEAGEVLVALGLVSRFGVATADQDLTAVLQSVSLKHSSNQLINQQFSKQFSAEIANSLIQNPSTFRNVEIRKSDYDALAKFAAYGQKVYRGLKIPNGTVMDNTCFVGFLLGANQLYLNGKDIYIEATFKCNVSPSLHFNASFTTLGNNLYLYKKTITAFDSNNSSKIFNYIQGKASTTATDVIITLEKLEISPKDLATSSAAIERFNQTRNKNITIKCGLTLGTYGEKYTNLVTAMHSFLDGTSEIGYDVIVDSGTYDLTTMFDYDNIVDQTPFKRGLELAPYVNLHGYEGTILNCKYTYGDARMTQAKYQAISPLNLMGSNRLSNIKCIAQNCRYVMHDDGNVIISNGVVSSVPFVENHLEMDNVYLEHLGNDPNILWTGTGGYISGNPSGKTSKFRRCTFVGKRGWSLHETNVMPKPLLIDIEDCKFITRNTDGFSFVLDGSWNNMTKNKVSLKNCTLNGRAKINNTSTSQTWELNGSGNTVVPWLSTGLYSFPEFSNEVYFANNFTSATIVKFSPVKIVSGAASVFMLGDNINTFVGIALVDIPVNGSGAVRVSGYIDATYLGLTAVSGDTLCLDSGVFVKNGINKRGYCDYAGFFKLI
ncbi:hypothetical protein F1649_07725 [Arcticibacter tournemirensis]|uniref:Uncharacterized protein n=1 Tax=Arcticibacter tournemirensis TaxID=699437 RepID=A0A5M9HEP4_9SPHI|nr:hypothetical protein [Arcticibacter tournemirensis]KAA8483768.1 hypothetical protein F1649_07725 [Arcticibacter tournemirensis]